jgi:hypothetical protein
MMKVGRIKMKVFPTHKWLETWCMKVLLIQKLKIKTQKTKVLDEIFLKKKNPPPPLLGRWGKSEKRN